MDTGSSHYQGRATDRNDADIRARCGFHCSRCPAYKNNIHTEADRIRIHDLWQKIYGMDMPVDELCCDGCLKPDDENPHKIGGACVIRSCVLEKNIRHCGLCSEFPCDLMERHLNMVESIDPKSLGLTEKEAEDFITPYLCRGFLME